jgi:hypothetical protein
MPLTLAICYSGEARDIAKTFENHRTRLFRDHEVHIYMHTWKDAGQTTPYELGVDNSWKAYPNVPNVDYIQILKPRRYRLDKRSMAPQTWKDRQVSMYTGISRSFDLVDPSVHYDYIIRIRPDVWFFEDVILPMRVADPNTVLLIANHPYIEGFNWDVPHENVSDLVGICTPTSLPQYRSFVFNPDNEPDVPIPTRQLGQHLMKHTTLQRVAGHIHVYRNVVNHKLKSYSEVKADDAVSNLHA